MTEKEKESFDISQWLESCGFAEFISSLCWGWKPKQRWWG